jgi:hypothetical protein
MKSNCYLKTVLLICIVLVQVHLTLFTVGNVLNPITLVLLFYYSPPFNGKYLTLFPEILIFTFQSVISFFVIYLLYHQKDFKIWIITYVVCLSLLIIGCHLSETSFFSIVKAIKQSKMANSYYNIYYYGQAFQYVIGYTIMQFILILSYYTLKLTIHLRR